MISVEDWADIRRLYRVGHWVRWMGMRQNQIRAAIWHQQMGDSSWFSCYFESLSLFTGGSSPKSH